MKNMRFFVFIGRFHFDYSKNYSIFAKRTTNNKITFFPPPVGATITGTFNMKIQDRELENVFDEIQKEIQKETGKRYTFAVYDVDDCWFVVCFSEPNGGDVELSMYIDDDWQSVRSKFETDKLSGIETPTDEEAYRMFVDKINKNFKRIVK